MSTDLGGEVSGPTLRPGKTRGGALLAVLWLSAGLAAIALSVSSNVRSETDRVSTSGEGLRASYLASGALERGILWVQWGFSGQNLSRARWFAALLDLQYAASHDAFPERRRSGGSDSGNLQARYQSEPPRTTFIASCSR